MHRQPLPLTVSLTNCQIIAFVDGHNKLTGCTVTQDEVEASKYETDPVFIMPAQINCFLICFPNHVKERRKNRQRYINVAYMLWLAAVTEHLG